MLASNDRTAVKFALSPGNAHDAPDGRKLLRRLENQTAKKPLLMDKAYEGNENREQAVEMGMEPIVPPSKSRKDPVHAQKAIQKSATKWRGYFADGKAIAESSPDDKLERVRTKSSEV